MFHFFSVSFPGLSVQDRLSVSEESRPWQTKPFAFAQGDMSKHDIVKLLRLSSYTRDMGFPSGEALPRTFGPCVCQNSGRDAMVSVAACDVMACLIN
jgi:hypothetical protein